MKKFERCVKFKLTLTIFPTFNLSGVSKKETKKRENERREKKKEKERNFSNDNSCNFSSVV